MKNSIVFFTLFIFCVSCATPTVVNVIGPNDNELTCKELNAEIALANKYADEAQEAKKMDKPHNISALLFFEPLKNLILLIDRDFLYLLILVRLIDWTLLLHFFFA